MNNYIIGLIIVIVIVFFCHTCCCIGRHMHAEYTANKLTYVDVPVQFRSDIRDARGKVESENEDLSVPNSKTEIRNLTEDPQIIRSEIVGDGENDAFSDYMTKKKKGNDFYKTVSQAATRVKGMIDESIETRRPMMPY